MPAPLLHHLLGSPEGAPPARLNRLLRRGDVGLQSRALREIGASGAPEAAPVVRPLLSSPAPAARRCAAWTLGQISLTADRDRLLDAAAGERCDAVRMSLAVAAVRCGAPVAVAWDIVARAAARTAMTWYGPRDLAAATGVGGSEMRRRWLLALNPFADDPAHLEPLSSASIRAEARLLLSREPESRPALKALAAQQHPADLALLMAAQPARRTRHALTEALGDHGDPRALRHLAGMLRAVVDPGQGFASRRTAAEALGRLGLPAAGRALTRALEAEALEFEGRPGAGLGIQFPVRSTLLVAIGECGAQERARVVSGYLSNTHGSAMGGFYLPAMDALWKLGAVAVLRPLLGSSEELVVANVLGVLALLGEASLVAPFSQDPRPRVRAAAVGSGG